MIRGAVLFFTLISTQLTLAATCKISKQSAVEVSGENFTATTSERNKVTFIEVDEIPPVIIQQAQSLLSQTSSPTPTLLLRIRFFLDQNKGLVANAMTNALYLQEALINSDYDYVAIETPADEIASRGVFAARFDPRRMEQNPDVQLAAEDVNSLVLLIVGPVIYQKARDPDLFKDVAIEHLDVQAEKVSAPPRKTSLTLDQALDKLSRNRQSHRQLQRVARELKTSKYRGLSDQEVKRRVLGRFWRPAKKTVSDWLDSELGSSRQTGQTSSSPAILSRKGKGLAFVSQNNFSKLEKDIRRYCAQ